MPSRIYTAIRLCSRSERPRPPEPPIHHGDPPEPPGAPDGWIEDSIQQLTGLKAVPEEAELAADGDPRLSGQGVVAGGARAGHHRLTDPLDQLLVQALLRHGQDQDRDARPAGRGLTGGPPRSCPTAGPAHR